MWIVLTIFDVLCFSFFPLCTKVWEMSMDLPLRSLYQFLSSVDTTNEPIQNILHFLFSVFHFKEHLNHSYFEFPSL